MGSFKSVEELSSYLNSGGVVYLMMTDSTNVSSEYGNRYEFLTISDENLSSITLNKKSDGKKIFEIGFKSDEKSEPLIIQGDVDNIEDCSVFKTLVDLRNELESKIEQRMAKFKEEAFEAFVKTFPKAELIKDAVETILE